MKRIPAAPLFGPVLALVWGCAPAEGPNAADAPDGLITTGRLYEEMVDLEGLTRFPDPAYKTVQFSSYDRRSNLPEGPDWFANSDGFGGEPIPGFESVLVEPGADSIGQYLMAEVDGPGALVRLWTARIDGEVKLFLDGSDDPLWEGPADDFFRRYLSAFEEASDLSMEALMGTIYQRDATYAPIPFARGLKLVWIGNLSHTHFYQVEVRTYELGTRVETFRPEDLRTYAETIDRVAKTLADPDSDYQIGRSGSSTGAEIMIDQDLGPGEAGDALEVSGPGALERLELKLEAPGLDEALRQVVLKVYSDGHRTPQVESPLGDFFGAAPGINPYESLPFAVRSDGTMVSRWVMPFKDSLRIRIENRGDQPVSVTGSALPAAYVWDDERSMHFRARWEVDHDMVPDPAAVQDLPFLMARGQGGVRGNHLPPHEPEPRPDPLRELVGRGRREGLRGRRHPALPLRHRLGGLLQLLLVHP